MLSKNSSAVSDAHQPCFSNWCAILRPGLLFNNEQRDSTTAFRRGIGATGNDVDVGVNTVRDERLRAFDQPAVAIANRAGSQPQPHPSPRWSRSERAHCAPKVGVARLEAIGTVLEEMAMAQMLSPVGRTDGRRDSDDCSSTIPADAEALSKVQSVHETRRT